MIMMNTTYLLCGMMSRVSCAQRDGLLSKQLLHSVRTMNTPEKAALKNTIFISK